MTNGFVALIFNFCAAISGPGEDTDTVKLGYISMGECIVKLIMGDSHGQTVAIAKHDISVEMLDGGAQINIDGQGFALIETSPA